MSKTKDLTIKQKKWLVEYFKTGNATQAALKAYDAKDPGTAANIGSENVRKLHDPVKLLMEQRGLSVGRLLDVLEDGLEANRVISAIGQADGKTTDFVEVPDHAIRHKYMETASKWLGVEKKDDTPKNQVNIVNLIQNQMEEYE